MNFFLPNLRHLRVFMEVARLKSISKASSRVFLSQPAITQAIAKLESLLGSSLFERCTNGVYLTPSGELFQMRVERALNEISQGIARVLLSRSHKQSQVNTQILPQLNATQLRALVAVTLARNFSIASRELGISQSSLHRSARELENLLQLPLFEKTSLGISATAAAQELARASQLAAKEIAMSMDEILSLTSKKTGSIVVGSMPLARHSMLPMAINQFLSLHPQVKVKVLDGPYKDLLQQLRYGDIDILIGALRTPLPFEDVQQESLYYPTLAVIGRKDHPLGAQSQISAEDLKDYFWVLPIQGTPTRKAFEAVFRESELEVPGGIIETSSQILIRELLLGSDRLTFISPEQMKYELAQGSVKLLPFHRETKRRAIGVTLRSNWQPTGIQAQFVTCLREQGLHAGMPGCNK